MMLRERSHEEFENPPRPVVQSDQAVIRASAERLLARGADAIERALSQDSAAFLSANRQEGGE